MTDVTATASGGSNNTGLHVRSSADVRQSKLSGSNRSLVVSYGTVKVALTQLVGPVTNASGTMQCFNNYNENMAAVTCP